MDNSKFYHSEQEFQFFNLIGRVNLKNGRCKYFIPTLSSNYGNYQINTFLVYNSQIDYRFFSSIIGLNQKWKFNFQQFVYPYKSDYNIEGFNVGDYLYIDEEWNLHRFIFYKAENNILYYYDDAGTKFKLLVNNDLIKLEKNDCYLFFNKDAGYLEKICSKFYDITKEFHYNNGLIDSIYDTRNSRHRVLLSYNEKKQIKYMFESNTNLTIEFGYDKNGNFNQISYKDNPFEKTSYKFIYQNKFLTQIIDIFKNHSMELTYNFDKLTMVKSTLIKVNHQKDYNVPELYLNEESASDLIYLSNKKIGIKNTEYSYDEELDVYNLINLNYTSSYCDVTIDNKDTIRYYFDTLGRVISSFKVNNNSFELLNDHHGIPLGYNGKTFNLNNTDNYVSNQLVYNSDDIDDLKEDLKDGIVENDYENYRSFTVSFFISTLATIGKNTKIKMIIDDETYYSYVQKCDGNVLQMCQIQILLPDTFWDKSKNHTWTIKLSNGMPFYIYDIRLNKSSISKITFIDDSYNVDELKKMTIFRYCVDNEYTLVSINNEINDNVDNEDFYFSLSDLLETCKSLYISRISNNPTFSLYYCNLTKIKEVEQASFFNGEQWFDLGLFTNRTANVRTHNVTHFNDDYYLTLEKEFSFNFDGGKNQLYLETKTFYNLGVEHSYLYDDICKKSYVWYNEDGTFRASCDEQNIMKEINYDSYGNIVEELVYKHGERNLPVSFVEYYYENEISNRRLPYAINHNGVIQSYDYDILGKVKRIYNEGVSDNSFKEGVYDDQKITYEYGNDLETLKAIKFERYVDVNNENDANTNNISDYQIVEKNEILINNQGLIKNIKNNYLNYEYDYDELFRLKNIKQNNQLVFANIYYPLYLENKNEIKKIWLDNYITINLDEHGQVDKLYIGKTIDTQYRVKSLELYSDLQAAVSKLNNIEIDSNSLSEVLNLSVYQSLEKDSFLQDSKYVVDKFSNSLHVYFKNNFIDSLNYKLIDDYNNIRQEIK
ncbi:MAG: hypothetical protein IKC22_04910, partial [Bacilli bacterium]|nr:hypothetical protein [Bacilli bacterium]